jgi:hypothetical protein
MAIAKEILKPTATAIATDSEKQTARLMAIMMDLRMEIMRVKH